MGVLTNIPPPPEGGYWPIFPLERILLLSRGGILVNTPPPSGGGGILINTPHCEKGGNLFFSNYNGNGIGMARRYWKNILLILRGWGNTSSSVGFASGHRGGYCPTPQDLEGIFQYLLAMPRPLSHFLPFLYLHDLHIYIFLLFNNLFAKSDIHCIKNT